MKILPVIHIQTHAHALSQAKQAIQLGSDGVFLINHHGDDQLTLSLARTLAAEYPEHLIGVNCLSMSPLEALHCAGAAKIRHLWLDHAGIHSTHADPSLQDAIAIQAAERGVTVYAGTAFKYQRPEPDPIKATLQAIQHQFIPTTSGAGTGQAADLSKVEQMSRSCNGQLALASGLTPENIHQFAPWIAYALVSTGISTPADDIDPARLRLFIERARSDA